MKKKFAVVSIILLVIIILMMFVPMLFKDQIAELVKKQANKQLNAVLNFESAGLNMFKSFPDLTLSINNLTIVNKPPFKGDTLLSAQSFNATIDLWSLVKGNAVRIKEVNLHKPNIKLLVLKDSTANYNIMKPDTVKPAAAPSQKQVNVALNYYSVDGANIAYIDQSSGMTAIIRNLDHEGSGDLSKDKFNLKTQTKIDQLTFEYNGLTYLNKVNAYLDMQLFADMTQKKFTLNKNELRINNLTVKFDGFVARPDTSSISMDLTFASNRTDFKDIVSLIPAAYSENFQDLKSSGKMILNGSVKGVYNKARIPSFNIKLIVQNGSFQYPKLPNTVRNVNVDLNVNNPGGTPDNTVVNLKQMHFELGGDPFDMSLTMTTPRSNPYIDTKVKGRLNLGQLKNALPMKGVQKLDGLVQADFQAKGNLGGLKNKRMDNLNASGTVQANNVVYGSDELTQEIKISQASLTLTPQAFKLNNFSMNIGQNNINANGGLYNMLGYLLNRGIISGNLALNSNYLDVNELMKLSKAEQKKTPPQSGTKVQAVELPERINFTMNSTIGKMIYDNLTLENVKGVIVISDRKLSMQSLQMNLLGGSLVATGYYATPAGVLPDMAFNLAVNNFDIGKTYESFVSVRQFAPMAQYIHGSFGAKMNITSSLDQTMMPIWNSFNGSGILNLQRAEVQGFKPFEAVGSALKIDALKNPVLTNVNPSFQIKGGRFYVQPFTYKVFNYDVTFSGSNGMDKSIDYTMNIQIPAGELKQQANQAINKLLKQDINLVSADKIDVKAFLKGNINNPSVTTSAADIVGGTAKTVQQQVQQKVQQEAQKQIEEKKAEIQKQAQQKADTVKQQLKKKAEEKLKDIFKKKF
ncbi:MAG TPA: AsmA-like C-terminal region-containing protein [Ignavibacteriales bacterium]|nr:AsmA-like C-terminal region-containing protein [Ignavibacteriales bacterium]